MGRRLAGGLVMTQDEARDLLRIVVLDANDVRDGFLAEGYGALLARAFVVIGVGPDGVPEPRAKTILTRAHRAATKVGLYASPVEPAEAAATVLRSAKRGSSK